MTQPTHQQITTGGELAALPDGTELVDEDGNHWQKQPDTVPELDGLLLWGPLTVVPAEETPA